MDAVFARPEIHRTRAERIAGAASDEAGQIGLARDHLSRRMPVRPLRLAADALHARPGETLAPDTDAITDGAALAEHIVKISIIGIDDDGTGRLASVEADNLLGPAIGPRGLLVRSLHVRACIALVRIALVCITLRIALVRRVGLILRISVAQCLCACGAERHCQQSGCERES